MICLGFWEAKPPPSPKVHSNLYPAMGGGGDHHQIGLPGCRGTTTPPLSRGGNELGGRLPDHHSPPPKVAGSTPYRFPSARDCPSSAHSDPSSVPGAASSAHGLPTAILPRKSYQPHCSPRKSCQRRCRHEHLRNPLVTKNKLRSDLNTCRYVHRQAISARTNVCNL